MVSVIHVLSGSNGFLLRTELVRLETEFATEYGDTALERLEGQDSTFERLCEALQSLPFLTPRKMVVLVNPGTHKQFTQAAAELFDNLPQTTDLVVVEPQPDKRSSYYKLLKRQPGYREYGDLGETQLAGWLVDRARDMGASLAANDARYIIERVGTDQQTLANELEKLALYSPQLNRQTIDELTAATPQSTIFALLEAAFAGNPERALNLYREQRQLKVEPPQIIAMLAWQLHVLALLKTAGQRSPDVVAREAHISPFVVGRSMSIARSLSLNAIRRMITDLLSIDERLKSQPLDADDALCHYLLAMEQR